jgi:hypothetical protein
MDGEKRNEVIAKGMIAFSENFARWLEEQEEKHDSECLYPCYVKDENNIVGIFGIRQADILCVRKIPPTDSFPDWGLSIMFGYGVSELLWFQMEDKRNAFFNKIKAEI